MYLLNDEFAWDETRASAARSLGQIGVASEEVVAALSRLLREERDGLNESPRRESASALGVLRAKPALQMLEKMSRDAEEYESARKAAAEAVRRIQLPE
jgi:HEAT repeat protein